MEKGKLGIRLSFYAVAAFILAFLGYSTVLALLAGFVLIVEKNEWASRQVIQAFFLCIFADIVNGILNIFDFLYQIPLMGSVWGTAISVIDGIVSLVVLIFCIMALVNTAKGNEANVPGLNGLANWAYGSSLTDSSSLMDSSSSTDSHSSMDSHSSSMVSSSISSQNSRIQISHSRIIT